MGPLAYAKHLISGPRLPFTAAYFGSIALTLYFAVGVSFHFFESASIPASWSSPNQNPHLPGTPAHPLLPVSFFRIMPDSPIGVQPHLYFSHVLRICATQSKMTSPCMRDLSLRASYLENPPIA